MSEHLELRVNTNKTMWVYADEFSKGKRRINFSAGDEYFDLTPKEAETVAAGLVAAANEARKFKKASK